MLPNTECDPYQTIMAAGELRAEASKLIGKAEVLEGAARMQLNLDDVAANSQTMIPGTVLCVAHGGDAHMQVTRIPFENLSKAKLVVNAPASQSVAQEIALRDYEPVVLIKLGQFYVGALLVPKGERVEGFRALGRAGIDDAIVLSMAKMITLSVGFNPGLAYGATQQMCKAAAANLEAEFDSPMLMQLGGPNL